MPGDAVVSAPTGSNALANPLGRAQAQWLTGDWHALAATDAQRAEQHAQRDKLALLVAYALQQIGQHEQAAHFARRAIAWGCNHRLVARLLLSGVHNTLGRIDALRQDDAGLRSHFEQAIAMAGQSDIAAATHGRALREMADLGLLPQAQALLRDELKSIDDGALRPGVVAARIEMLRSEVGLLQHELSLAQQRHRHFVRDDGADMAGDANLRQRSTSQLGQDLWVLERTGYKRDGFFVEFGATDGVRLSNTYLLEAEFGWRGICAEPNPRMFAELQRNRRCITSDACIGPRTGDRVEFVLAEEYGGLVSDMSDDMHAAKRQAYYADDVNRAVFVTESLADLLTRFDAPRDIDYLSIDTEGSEYEILSTFPFDRWNIRLLTVEHNFGSSRAKLRRLLESRGYKCTEAKWDDWYERIT